MRGYKLRSSWGDREGLEVGVYRLQLRPTREGALYPLLPFSFCYFLHIYHEELPSSPASIPHHLQMCLIPNPPTYLSYTFYITLLPPSHFFLFPPKSLLLLSSSFLHCTPSSAFVILLTLNPIVSSIFFTFFILPFSLWLLSSSSRRLL